MHASIAKSFDVVPGRYRNFYVNPSDNGYLCVQNTFKIYGQDVEVQIVDLESHINNSIGSASHFLHKVFVRKHGDGKRDNTAPTDLIAAFNNASRWVVVRTAEDFYVLKKGATVANLARKIHTELLAKAVSAVITDRDPTRLLDRVRVPLTEPLRSGQLVLIEVAP